MKTLVVNHWLCRDSELRDARQRCEHRRGTANDPATPPCLGFSASFLAKIFPKLEKARIVVASEGVRGGYKLARDSNTITVLDVIDAVEGRKPLFDCQQIRGRCAIFNTPGLDDQRRLQRACRYAQGRENHAR
jgi:hypothetical protein